jgi:hypothetical protein
MNKLVKKKNFWVQIPQKGVDLEILSHEIKMGCSRYGRIEHRFEMYL